MANYIGARCPICNGKFVQQDDIVVCPVCGAPHHRACYAQKNECAFVSEHMSGSVWRPPAPDPAEAEQTARKCPSCGNRIPEDALFCQHCGSHLHSVRPPRQTADEGRFMGMWGFPGMEYMNDPLYTVYGGVNPEDMVGNVPVKELAIYVGRSSGYYLPRFRHMDRTGQTISPNFSALLFNFLFYFYRKMYLVGAALLALYAISTIPGFLYSLETLPITLQQMGLTAAMEYAGWHVPPVEQVDIALAEHYYRLGTVTQMINFIIGIVTSLCANRIYFTKCIRSILKIGKKEPAGPDAQTRQWYEAELAKHGGTSKLAPALAIVGVVVLAFAASLIAVVSILSGP